MALLLLLLLLDTFDTAHALVRPPRETSLAEGASGLTEGWTPKPTPAPRLYANYAGMPKNALFARQDAQGATCGWIDGNADYAITCGVSSVCALYGNDSPPGFECCPTTTDSSTTGGFVLSLCPYKSACLNYGAADNGNGATSAVISNYILLCGSSDPECFTVANTYSVGSTGTTYFSYGCYTNTGLFFHAAMYTTTSGSIPNSDISSRVAETSSAPATQSSTATSSASQGSSQSSASAAQTTAISASPSGQASTSTTAVSSAAPVTVGTSHAPSQTSGSATSGSSYSSGTSGTSGSTSSPTGKNNGGNSSNVGAIAGGTVGGVAAVALIGAAIGYLIYRKKKQRVQPMPEVSQYSGGYDSVNNGGYGAGGGEYGSPPSNYGNTGGYGNGGGYARGGY